MNFAAIFQDGVAHILNDTGQAVCSYVRVSIHQDVGAGTMLYKDVQNALAVATFLAARVQLAVAVSASSTFAKRIVALRIYALFRSDTCKVFLPFMYILSSLNDNGAKAQFYQSQGRKKAAWACSNNNHLWGIAYVVIFDGREEKFLWLLIHVNSYCQVYINGVLPGINTTFQYPYGLRFYTFFLLKVSHDTLFVICLLRQYSEVDFACHILIMYCKSTNNFQFFARQLEKYYYFCASFVQD